MDKKKSPYNCQCAKCRPCDLASPLSIRMILCQKCWNKRCPHAEWHGYECTGSNEPGQVGVVSDESIKLMSR